MGMPIANPLISMQGCVCLLAAAACVVLELRRSHYLIGAVCRSTLLQDTELGDQRICSDVDVCTPVGERRILWRCNDVRLVQGGPACRVCPFMNEATLCVCMCVCVSYTRGGSRQNQAHTLARV